MYTSISPFIYYIISYMYLRGIDFSSVSTIFAIGFWDFSDNVVFICSSFYYNINIFLQKQQVHMIEKQITLMIVKR